MYMPRENNVQSRMDAVQFLILNGTQKKITMQYCSNVHGFTEKSYAGIEYVKPKHRQGTHWLKSDGLYVADRALRLFLKMFTVKKLDRILTYNEYHKLCETYMTMFPQDDEMSTNRMHYLIDSIRRQDVTVHESCKCCKKYFITHRDKSNARICSICAH